MGIYLGLNEVNNGKLNIVNQNYTLENAFLNKTITNYSNSNIGKIRSYAFRECDDLISVYAPNCSYIDDYGFTYCSNLQYISCVNCESIGYYTFRGCSNLQSIIIHI